MRVGREPFAWYGNIFMIFDLSPANIICWHAYFGMWPWEADEIICKKGRFYTTAMITTTLLVIVDEIAYYQYKCVGGVRGYPLLVRNRYNYLVTTTNNQPYTFFFPVVFILKC